jgi:hypothetical protein
MRTSLIGLAAGLCTALMACSPAATPPGPAAASTAATSSSASASAPAPTPAADAAELKAALVTATDLGKPWVRPKKVATVAGKKNEVCPGHVSALRATQSTAEVSANFTEGTGNGKNIASFVVKTLPDENDASLVTAYRKDQKACGTYTDGAGFTVVRTVEGPSSIDGAERVATWVERVYYVKPHKLAYARHYLVARQGRVVTSISYAFLTVPGDPDAKKFDRAAKLLQVQLAKNSRVFG